MTLEEWRSIPWQTRNEIGKRYGIKRSADVKVVQIAPGVDSVEDDGVRELDLNPIRGLTIGEAIAGAISKEAKEEAQNKPTEKPTEKPTKAVGKKSKIGKKTK